MGEYYACRYYEGHMDNYSLICRPFETVLDIHSIVTSVDNVVFPFKTFATEMYVKLIFTLRHWDTVCTSF